MTKEEFIEEYMCYDQHGESCCDCGECRDNITRDLDELLKRAEEKGRAEMMESFLKLDKACDESQEHCPYIENHEISCVKCIASKMEEQK